MSTDLEVQQALMAAHEAGDVTAAKALAAEILRRRGVKSPKAIRDATQDAVDPHIQAAKNFAQDMPLASQIAAGAGKAPTDLAMGIRQIVGNASQQQVDEKKALDAPLMNTAGGMGGNIGGNVAMSVLPGLGAVSAGKNLAMPAVQAAGKLALTAPANMTGALVSGGMGGVQGLLQPVATGDSRAVNAGAGLIGGAAVPVAGMALKAGKGLLEPLYQGGRDAIVGRALRSAAGDNADTIIQNLKGAKELVPGSKPTAAEVADSGGIAAMQRAASAVDPEAYATRAAQQNEARIGLLDSLAGTQTRKEAAAKAREAAAGPLYKSAREAGVDPEMAKVLQPQINNLMERMPSGVMEKARELARLNGETLGKDGSVQGLHYMKLAVDDMLDSGKQTGIGSQMSRGLMQFKNDLVTVIDDLSPQYKKARETFAAKSKPINQMDVAQEISDKSVNKLTGLLQPQSYAKALSDDTAVRATGFSKATLADTMGPKKLGQLEAIKEDLMRSVAARDMGRGAGSDTVQKLAMTNLMQQSGLPVGLLNMPGLGRLGNWVYSNADEEMKRSLAHGLLNPSQTARLMEKATPNEKAALVSGLLRMTATPVATGGTMGLLGAQ